jgi:hypothetical protein
MQYRHPVFAVPTAAIQRSLRPGASALVISAAVHRTPICGFFQKRPVHTGRVVVALKPQREPDPQVPAP